MTKILIIEDEEPIRRVLVRILIDENKKFYITESKNGKEGVSLLKREKFDLVLSINTIHNLTRDLCKQAIKEILRVSKGKEFIQVDSYKTEEQKKIFANIIKI